METLTAYVEEVTAETSPQFIPVEDRIAVFDMDGTVLCELYPAYFEWLMFVNRAMDDPNYNAPDDVRHEAERVLAAIDAGNQWPSDMGKTEALMGAKAFAGMTTEEYADYVREFMKSPAEGFSNMTRGEAFYQPMLEVIAYLQQNDFLVYIVTGTDRLATRVLIEEVIDIPPRQVIGMDVNLEGTGQDGKDGLDYVFDKEDTVERSDTLIIKSVEMNKVSLIAQEIGQQPVLAFGNSSGDASMMTYTISDNPHKSMAFLVVNDDNVREYGTAEASDKMKAFAQKSGWTVISMRDDFSTIYGDSVTATGKTR
ncbi:MAG: HAD family hydrolase [Oscillospiraceae bacterium]